MKRNLKKLVAGTSTALALSLPVCIVTLSTQTGTQATALGLDDILDGDFTDWYEFDDDCWRHNHHDDFDLGDALRLILDGLL